MSLLQWYPIVLLVSVVLHETHPRLGPIYEEELYKISVFVSDVVLARSQNEYQIAISIFHLTVYLDLFCRLKRIQSRQH